MAVTCDTDCILLHVSSSIPTLPFMQDVSEDSLEDVWQSGCTSSKPLLSPGHRETLLLEKQLSFDNMC